MDYTVSVGDEVDPHRAQQGLNRFARSLETGEVLVTPLPAGFPMGRVPEVALRIKDLLTRIIEADAVEWAFRQVDKAGS